MPDYTKHIMQNWDWCNTYRSLLGKKAFDKYVNGVYELLLSMKPDSYYSIEKNVKPENIDLFIKICCMFIQEQFMSDRQRDFSHSFNADCTQIQCTRLYYSRENSNNHNDKNDV